MKVTVVVLTVDAFTELSEYAVSVILGLSLHISNFPSDVVDGHHLVCLFSRM